jgi:hypothetical protein
MLANKLRALPVCGVKTTGVGLFVYPNPMPPRIPGATVYAAVIEKLPVCVSWPRRRTEGRHLLWNLVAASAFQRQE